jgi:CRISPR-associated protein Cas1
MMTLPDFREKQLLFIAGSDIKENNLSFKNENICLSREGKIINQLSCHKTLALFVTGECTLTSVLIRKCARYGVSLFLLRDNFECYADIVAEAAGNYILRIKQYHLGPEQELHIAKAIVQNRIETQYALLKERSLAQPDWLEKKLQSVAAATNGESLLGCEGSTTKEFYASYFKEMKWYRRLPRAKVDINNVLLDIGYTFMFNMANTLLSLFGFDTYKGVYHKLFFQRKSLACDIMEPLRCIIERQLLKSYNLKQIDPKDFIQQKDVWLLSYENQKKYTTIFANAIMERKEDIFNFIRSYYYHILNETDAPPEHQKPLPKFIL